MNPAEQRLPDGYHWHVDGQTGRAYPTPDPECGHAPFDVLNDAARPLPLALPGVGARVLRLRERTAS